MSDAKPAKTEAPGASHPGAAAHPTQQKLVLRDLVVHSNVGVTAEERAKAQRICVNVELELEPRGAARDEIDAVISYSHLAKAVRAVCTEDDKTKLLETLAARVAEVCLSFGGARSVRVRMEKLDRYPDMSGVGIDMTFVPSV